MEELWGIFIGIKFAVQHEYRRLNVESDSKVVVEAIRDGGKKNFNNNSLVRKIRSWLDKFDVVDIKHIHREANKCAHLLATAGKNSKDGTSFFLEVPSW